MATDTGLTVNIWCANCQDYVKYMAWKDGVGALHIAPESLNAHRATH